LLLANLRGDALRWNFQTTC